MRNLNLHTLSDFFKELEKLTKEYFDKDANLLWFRGQSKSDWNLTPGIYRHYEDLIKNDTDGDVISFIDFKRIEKNMFTKFANSYIFKKENEKSLWRTYYYMQHYGVQTRLLDWTENPLIGLFFAVVENSDSDGTLWVLDPISLNSETIGNLINLPKVKVGLPIFNDEKPCKGVLFDQKNKKLDYDALSYKYFNLHFEEDEPGTPLALAPIRLDNRMEMQQSCFTVFGNKINGLHKNSFQKKVLSKIHITRSSKFFLKKELLQCGINFSRIFPDLDGLGKEINLEYFMDLAVFEKIGIFHTPLIISPTDLSIDNSKELIKQPVELLKRIESIRHQLKQTNDFEENRINELLEPVLPFQSKDQVSLIIIGQDPTIKNEKTRALIKYTLNLNRKGSLKNYISAICSGLDITIEKVYATNIFKYFYTIPPAQTLHVLQAHLEPNLELLKEELAAFPDAKVITLGEPVLQLLTHEKNRVREYWDYNNNTKQTTGKYKYCDASDNKLNRVFYPFPHQPSIRKAFYKNNFEEYIKFVKNQS